MMKDNGHDFHLWMELHFTVMLEEYCELLHFIEQVYLVEYKLKILLARKFSNLYFAFIDLVREQDLSEDIKSECFTYVMDDLMEFGEISDETIRKCEHISMKKN